jgi:hypothetical protein
MGKSFGHGEIVKEPGGWTGRLTAVPLVWILWTTCALSQTTTATLQGTVRDTTQAVLPGASVTIRNTSTGYVRSTTTNERGDYFLAYIPVGMYTLTVEHEGFNKQIREDLHFLVGQQATVDIILSVATLATELIVQGKPPRLRRPKVLLTRSSIENRSMIFRWRIGGRHLWRYWLQAWFPRVIRRSRPSVEASRGAAAKR